MTKRKEKPAKHTHKYIKIGGKYTPLWRCASPDCRHFVYTAQENVIVGRNSICWECGLVFIMDDDAMQEDQPRCFACRNPEIDEDVDIEAILRRSVKEDKPESEDT